MIRPFLTSQGCSKFAPHIVRCSSTEVENEFYFIGTYCRVKSVLVHFAAGTVLRE